MRTRERASATRRNAGRAAIWPGLAVAGLVVAATSACAQKPVHFTRIDASPLRIALPGLAVIRDSAQWVTLWQRWDGAKRWAGITGAIVHDTIPRIDFRHEMAIAVALGQTSGCSNVQRNVGRVVEGKDSIIVFPPPGLFGPRLTCMMEIEPVDVVRLPHSGKRVVFHAFGLRRPLPSASWWWSPSAAEFDAADTAKQSAFAVALIVDPATPFTTVEAITRYAVADPVLSQLLVADRPEVRTNVRLLTMLARSSAGDSALAVLFRDFGTTVAADSSTPRDVLIKFIRHLGPRTAGSHDVAARLLENPTIATDSQLVVRIVDAVQDRDLRATACRLYWAHWPNWQATTHPDSSFIGWSPRVSCRV